MEFFVGFRNYNYQISTGRKKESILMKTEVRNSISGLLLIPHLLACFAAVFISATPSASASDQVPFRAAFSTEFTSVFVPPSFLSIAVTGQGNASHMGETSAVTDNQVVNLEDGSATATYTLTGANGDTVVLEMIFQVTEIPGGVSFEGSYTVTGGTGRFDGATGDGLLVRSAIFTGPTNGVGSFSVAGTISSPGSLN
jgi:hypothetical protein